MAEASALALAPDPPKACEFALALAEAAPLPLAVADAEEEATLLEKESGPRFRLVPTDPALLVARFSFPLLKRPRGSSRLPPFPCSKSPIKPTQKRTFIFQPGGKEQISDSS